MTDSDGYVPEESGTFIIGERAFLDMTKNKTKIQWPTVVIASVAVVAGTILLGLGVGDEYAAVLFGLAAGAVSTKRVVE